MLTIEQIRKVAQQSGARDITKVETDIILTYLLQLLHEKGVTKHIAFKGGTMLRKMIFGPRAAVHRSRFHQKLRHRAR
jgi:predicted nucleotidyltransferase component of viral defense system